LSAELNGILTFYEDKLHKRQQDQHYLLCTDTWLGEQTAQLVKFWLEKHGLGVQLYRQSDLKTEDLTSFQLALSEIVKKFSVIIEGYCNQEYYIVFNLTGGFKSVQGFLQTLAMFYADEAIYIFETGTELLRIPRLPLQMSPG